MNSNQIIIPAIITVILLIALLLYNNIIRKKNQTKNAFGSVETMLKKRYDLLPNLVEVTKTYMNHEKDLLESVTQLRSSIDRDRSLNSKVQDHIELEKKANSILMNVENYPILLSNKNFLHLQSSWNTMEEQISASRRFYNTAVTEYNNAIETFPGNFIADVFGFKALNVFEAQIWEKENVKAKDLFKS